MILKKKEFRAVGYVLTMFHSHTQVFTPTLSYCFYLSLTFDRFSISNVANFFERRCVHMKKCHFFCFVWVHLDNTRTRFPLASCHSFD